MKTKALQFIETLRYSFWFLPASMSLCAAALAFVMSAVEQGLNAPWMSGMFWIYAGTPEDARAVLSLIANSMVGIASVIFSVTVLMLTLATRRYGQQLLKDFMRDLVTQISLGAFISVFVYCILVILMMKASGQNMPRVTVSMALFLSIIGVGVLILFIQHIVGLMQSENIIAGLSKDINGIIEDLYPARVEVQEAHPGQKMQGDGLVVETTESGYLRSISVQELLKTATDAGITVRAERQVGDFLLKGSPLLTLWPGQKGEHGIVRRIKQCFTISRNRMPRQDIRYAVGQLVEIAITALSSTSISPSTIHMCIDRFREILCHLAQKEEPQGNYFDDRGNLRVSLDSVKFAEVAGFIREQLRRHGAGDITVMIRLLKGIAEIAGCARRDKDRVSLLNHAENIREAAMVAASQKSDKEYIEKAYRGVISVGGKK